MPRVAGLRRDLRQTDLHMGQRALPSGQHLRVRDRRDGCMDMADPKAFDRFAPGAWPEKDARAGIRQRDRSKGIS